MKKIIYTRPDGGCSVVTPAPNARRPDESEAAFLARIRQKSVPANATDIRIVEPTEIPSDREFRGAWRQRPEGVVVDLLAAREIQRQRIERVRLEKAIELSRREMLGENVAAEKAELRAINAQSLVDAAQDVDELKAAWPASLSRLPRRK